MPTAAPARLIPHHLSVYDVYVIVPTEMHNLGCSSAITRVLDAHGLLAPRATVVCVRDDSGMIDRATAAEWCLVSLANTSPIWMAPAQPDEYDRAVRRVRSLIYATLAAVRADSQPTDRQPIQRQPTAG